MEEEEAKKATQEMEQRAAHYRSELVLQPGCRHTFGSLVECRCEGESGGWIKQFWLKAFS